MTGAASSSDSQTPETPDAPLNAAQVYSGVRWSALGQVASQSARLVVSIVLARLLAPADFGLLTMAGAFTALATLFSNLGAGPAIVQHPRLNDLLLRSLVTLGVAVGLASTLAFVVTAGLIADFYGEPRVVWVVAALGTTFVISSFGLVPQGLLQREMRFRDLVLVDLAALVVRSAVAVGMAATGFGVWALVISNIAGTLIQAVLLVAWSPWRLRFGFRWSAVREVAGFSASVMGFSINQYLVRNSDNLIVGRALGAVQLGYYDYAYRLFMYPVEAVSGVLIRVMFPAFAKLQDQPRELGRAFLRANGAIALITFPMMAGLGVLAGPVVRVLLGDKWAPVIPLISILAPVGMLQSIGATAGQLMLARGQAALRFWWSVIYTVVLIAAFLVGVRWGILGVTIALATVMVPLFAVNFWLGLRLVDMGLLDLIRWLRQTTGATVIMGACVLALRYLLSVTGAPTAVQLVVCVPSGALVYTALSRWLAPPALTDVFRLLPAGVRVRPTVRWLFGQGADRVVAPPQQ